MSDEWPGPLQAGSVEAGILAGVLLATRGWPALRAFLFALLFIAFLVPLPGFFVDALTAPLKNNVSAIAEQLLYTAGYARKIESDSLVSSRHTKNALNPVQDFRIQNK